MKNIFNYPISKEIPLREYLLSYHLAKPKIYKLFQEKNILVNQMLVKENYILKPGDIVSIIQEENIDFLPENGPVHIIYEDSYFLIIDKPSGMIIHPENKDEGGTLVNLVAAYYKKKNLDLNIRYAHRLDRETTGIIVFCKDILTHAYMNYFISLHEIKREYRAIVQGCPKELSGRITLPIGNDRHQSNKMVVSKNGKEAITNYQVLYQYKGYSLVKVLLETGRTHQIRLHMSAIGAPLLGDILYGGNCHFIKRVALHSYQISFIHPVTEEKITLKADLPMDMKTLLQGVKK